MKEFIKTLLLGLLMGIILTGMFFGASLQEMSKLEEMNEVIYAGD